MSQPDIADQTARSDDMQGIETQLSQLTMTAQDAQSPSIEHTATQPISEGALSTNWIRIFEQHHPTQRHVLDPYRDSDKRMILSLIHI